PPPPPPAGPLPHTPPAGGGGVQRRREDVHKLSGSPAVSGDPALRLEDPPPDQLPGRGRHLWLVHPSCRHDGVDHEASDSSCRLRASRPPRATPRRRHHPPRGPAASP